MARPHAVRRPGTAPAAAWPELAVRQGRPWPTGGRHPDRDTAAASPVGPLRDGGRRVRDIAHRVLGRAQAHGHRGHPDHRRRVRAARPGRGDGARDRASYWLLLCTILLALFLTFGKRRHELLTLEAGATDQRPILSEYTPQLLDQMIKVVTASTFMAYALYAWPRRRTCSSGRAPAAHDPLRPLRHLPLPLSPVPPRPGGQPVRALPDGPWSATLRPTLRPRSRKLPGRRKAPVRPHPTAPPVRGSC